MSRCDGRWRDGRGEHWTGEDGEEDAVVAWRAEMIARKNGNEQRADG